eukprot:745911-Hanusia_phi.AAC.1
MQAGGGERKEGEEEGEEEKERRGRRRKGGGGGGEREESLTHFLAEAKQSLVHHPQQGKLVQLSVLTSSNMNDCKYGTFTLSLENVLPLPLFCPPLPPTLLLARTGLSPRGEFSYDPAEIVILLQPLGAAKNQSPSPRAIHQSRHLRRSPPPPLPPALRVCDPSLRKSPPPAAHVMFPFHIFLTPLPCLSHPCIAPTCSRNSPALLLSVTCAPCPDPIRIRFLLLSTSSRTLRRNENSRLSCNYLAVPLDGEEERGEGEGEGERGGGEVVDRRSSM